MTGITHHGVFLRPDARTCAAVTSLTAQLRAQYGLVSAGAFPPHVTLAGSLSLGVPEQELLDALAPVVAELSPFPVRNHGLARVFGSLVHDVHPRDDPDPPLTALAAAVDGVVRPRLAEPSGMAPVTYEPGVWHAHLSLASHDLHDRPDLFDEVEEFVRDLGVDAPSSFTADTVAVYRFEDETWTGAWWRTMRWQHVRSLRLRPT